jgi:Tol biopolymer transport system component
MRTKVSSLLPAALALLAFCNPTVATWTEPVPVPQVNTEYGDWSPFLSYDGLTLYFSRVDTPQFYYHRIYQATREDASALFTKVTEISSLNYSGGHVVCPWVSPDNLRMYYWRTELGSGHRLKVSKRESTDEAWPAGDDISELNILGSCLHGPNLTQDELTTVFTGYNLPGGRGNYDLYIATRPDLSSPFGNVVNLTQLNTPATEADPFISPDGRSLYFTSNVNGYFQIYKATRESLEEPFGAIEHLSFFDSYGANSRSPSISSDGNAFYFCRELEGAVVSADIYVSYISDISETKTYYTDAVSGNDSDNGLRQYE